MERADAERGIRLLDELRSLVHGAQQSAAGGTDDLRDVRRVAVDSAIESLVSANIPVPLELTEKRDAWHRDRDAAANRQALLEAVYTFAADLSTPELGLHQAVDPAEELSPREMVPWAIELLGEFTTVDRILAFIQTYHPDTQRDDIAGALPRHLLATPVKFTIRTPSCCCDSGHVFSGTWRARTAGCAEKDQCR